jgi:hypothetical protein
MNTQFQQKSKVGVAGNFINQMMGNNATIPVVGQGMTELHYSDRSVYEVIEVSDDLKTVKVEYLEASHDKTKQGGMGHQNWVLTPTGYFKTLVWRNNQWKVKGFEVTFTKEFRAQSEEAGHFCTHKALTPEQKEFIYAGNVWPQNVLGGLTRRRDTYHPIKVLFGVKDYRYDWEF